MDMGVLDAIKTFLVHNVNDLHELQTPPNEIHLITPSCIITKKKHIMVKNDVK